jgi:DNA-binding response OmpR family regulator
MKILVVEDDPIVADALRATLGDRNYAVEVADDGQAGLEFIEAFDYDLLLLDAVLPKLDGVSLCRYVRSRGYMMPILLLTSKDSKHDRAIGLDAGADDYVVKPFEPEELSARIRALLRRGNDRMQPVLTWNRLTLDPRNYEVSYQDSLLNLTPKEYALLELFLRYRRRLFSCGAILEHLWTYEDTPSEEAVRTHIKGLRHKLKAAGAPADFIETVYGIGYRLKLGEPALAPTLAQPQRQLGGDPQSELDRQHEPAPLVVRQPPPVDDSLQFLTEIWNRHHDRMLERVAAIDLVVIASTQGALTPEICQEAWHCAHTLAGALGTFGLILGSQVAKQIELLLKENPELTPAQIDLVQSGAVQLRQEIASKVPATAPLIAPPAPIPSPWLLAIADDLELVSALQSTPSNFETIVATELTPSQLDRSPQAIILDLDCFARIADGLNALSELERDYPQIPVLVLSRSHSRHSKVTPEREMSAVRHRSNSAVMPQFDRLSRLSETAVVSSDGIEIARKATPQLHHRIEVARRGARLFLAKPLLPAQIFGAVDRVLHQARATQVRVTIVDDDPLLLEGVSALLARRGMTVTTLSEPSRFWEILEASAPDLLILDLDMPTYDGIELCRAVRTDPAWETLPILFLTAHTATIASDLVFAAGADDFVAKPAIESTLVTRIVNRLERIGVYRKG